jgi:hypothetical protein
MTTGNFYFICLCKGIPTFAKTYHFFSGSFSFFYIRSMPLLIGFADVLSRLSGDIKRFGVQALCKYSSVCMHIQITNPINIPFCINEMKTLSNMPNH